MSIDTLDPKIQTLIENQIKYIRRMSILTDEQLRAFLVQHLIEHPHLVEKYEAEEQIKMMHDIKKAAKDVKSSPLKLARKVDGGIKL